MTTCTFREGVLAADSLVTDRGLRVGMTADKAWREKDGSLVACCGCLGSVAAFKNWFGNGRNDGDDICKPQLDECFEALHISPKGEVTWYGHNLLGVTLESEFYAIGSGTEIAMGAMAMGASAEKAVEVAREFDTKTGGKIHTFTLGVKKR